TLIGLSAKNAILIVEYARLRRSEGKSIVDSALDAARLRLRPILMTSFAFILGVMPLTVANGAGAASRRALGTSVFGGMITATLLAVFVVPVLYAVIQRFAERPGDLPQAQPSLSVSGVVSCNKPSLSSFLHSSYQFPVLDADGQFTAIRNSKVGQFKLPSGSSLLSDVSYTQAGFRLGWELDVWGRLRRLTEAARAQYLASEEGRRGVVTTLVSDVMTNYFRLRELDLDLSIALKNR